MGKIVLGDRKTKEITLPVSGATIVIYSSMIAKDFDEVITVDGDIKRGLNVVTKLIKSWNVYESEDAKDPVPITIDSVGNLPAPDITFIMKEADLLYGEQKKS